MFRLLQSRSAALMAGVGGASMAALPCMSWKALKVTQKDQVNHNTVSLRLAFDSPEQVAGLPVASCILTRAPIGSKKEDGSTAFVIRPYTPVSEPNSKGHLDLIVKVYPEGKMSKHIGDLKVGETVECKGPIEKLPYKANMKKSLGLIAGGTGLTPMLQVAEEVLRNAEDKTDVSFIFANQSPKDILMKDHIDSLAKKHDNFHVFYVVDKAPMGGIAFKGATGYITEDIVKQHCPAPSDDSMILVCGPPPMMKAISGDKAEDKSQGELSGLLAKMGYSKEQVYKF